MELSLCHKIWFYNHYIFGTKCCRPFKLWILSDQIIWVWNIKGLHHPVLEILRFKYLILSQRLNSFYQTIPFKPLSKQTKCKVFLYPFLKIKYFNCGLFSIKHICGFMQELRKEEMVKILHFKKENGNNVLKVIQLGYRSESKMSLYKGHLKFYYIVPLILLYSPFKFKEKIERDIPYLPS